MSRSGLYYLADFSMEETERSKKNGKPDAFLAGACEQVARTQSCDRPCNALLMKGAVTGANRERRENGEHPEVGERKAEVSRIGWRTMSVRTSPSQC